MISFKFNVLPVVKAFDQVTKYYIDGLLALEESGTTLTTNVSNRLLQEMYIYLDSMTRADPARYKHMYEWDQAGDSSARLFRLTNTVHNNVSNLDFQYLDSTKPVPDSTQVFRNKAQALEEGWTFHISPVHSDVLAFEDDGETVFVRGTIVTTPGQYIQGNFTRLIDDYISYVAPSTVNRILSEFNMFHHFKQGALTYKNGREAMHKDVNSINDNTTGNK